MSYPPVQRGKLFLYLFGTGGLTIVFYVRATPTQLWELLRFLQTHCFSAPRSNMGTEVRQKCQGQHPLRHLGDSKFFKKS